MNLRNPTIIAMAMITLIGTAKADPSAPSKEDRGRPLIPAGTWKIKFSNGVVEKCTVHPDGTASVVEPLRSSAGKPNWEETESFVIVFADDRTERWTTVGNKIIVEHWYPSSRFPNGDRVLGIAKKVR